MTQGTVENTGGNTPAMTQNDNAAGEVLTENPSQPEEQTTSKPLEVHTDGEREKERERERERERENERFFLLTRVM